MTEDIRDAGIILEAIKIGIAQSSRDGYVLRLGLDPTSVPPEIMTSHIGTRYKVVMVEMDTEGNPVISQDQQDGAKAVKQAGLMCRQPTFHSFLSRKLKTPVINEDEAAFAVCEMLGIPSRKVLASNREARSRWLDLMSEFNEAHHRGDLR